VTIDDGRVLVEQRSVPVTGTVVYVSGDNRTQWPSAEYLVVRSRGFARYRYNGRRHRFSTDRGTGNPMMANLRKAVVLGTVILATLQSIQLTALTLILVKVW
jgi:hypothetical protein